MQRTPEPQLMEECQQVEAYAAADFNRSDLQVIRGIERLCQAHQWQPRDGDCVLDLGCGPGNISERLARLWPQCHVIGIDGSDPMLEIARRRQVAAGEGVASRLSYEALCIGSLARGELRPKALEGRSGAALIVSNSLLHHLHDPGQLWRLHQRLARPGCLVLHRDLRRPPSPERALALREKHLGAAPSVLRHDYLASLHAAFTPGEVLEQLRAAELQCLEVVELEDRYLEIRGALPSIGAGVVSDGPVSWQAVSRTSAP